MIMKFIHKVKESDFVKNIVTLASGAVIGYGINTITLPLISRIYARSDIGSYDLVTSSASIIITVLCMALTLVIMIPADEREAVRICKIIWYANITGTVIIVVILFGISRYYQLFVLNIRYEVGILLFAVYILTYNLQVIFYSFTNRKMRYRVLFWNPIVMAGVNAGVSLILGLLGLGTVGYLIGTILSHILGILHMRLFVNPFSGHDGPSQLWHTLKKYKAYPLVQLPANLISSFALQLPIQFLGRIYDPGTLGGYTMACKLLSMPIAVLATPINRVYYRTLVDKVLSGQDTGDFAFAVIKNNIKTGILPVGVLMVFGDFITSMFLGDEWRVSGRYILILGLMYILNFSASCVSGTFVAVNQQKAAFLYSLVTLCQYALCFMSAYYLELDIIGTIIMYTASVIINQVILLSLYMYYTGYAVRKFLFFIVRYLLASALIIYGSYAMRVCFGL